MKPKTNNSADSIDSIDSARVMQAPPHYRIARLNKLIASGKVDNKKTQLLDCYNQVVYEDYSPTLTGRNIENTTLFISEEI